eukprot:2388796-Rhodomonas_salina.1
MDIVGLLVSPAGHAPAGITTPTPKYSEVLSKSIVNSSAGSGVAAGHGDVDGSGEGWRGGGDGGGPGGGLIFSIPHRHAGGCSTAAAAANDTTTTATGSGGSAAAGGGGGGGHGLDCRNCGGGGVEGGAGCREKQRRCAVAVAGGRVCDCLEQGSPLRIDVSNINSHAHEQ